MVEIDSWSFLTTHAQVLICLAEDPDVRLRDVGDAVGITERAAHRMIRPDG
jgi:predicted transcriptional regulator